MDFDLLLTIGMIVTVFSIPSIVSAFSENRAPRVAALVLVLGGGLVAYAVTQKPGGYTLDQVPDVMVNTIAKLIS